MKRYVWMSALAALTITFSATAAQATPITLDFTAGKYAGAHNEWHFETVDQGVTVDLWSGVFEKLTYDAVNGIGIDGWGGDNGEVGDDELVLSGFSPDQYIYEVELAQLFAIGSYAETGYYRLNNSGGWIPFAATNSDGSYSLIINKSVSSIAFTGDCEVGCLFNDDFSIKSIRVEGPTVNTVPDVPAPATMMLLGAGFLGVAAQRLRKKNQVA